MAVVTPTFVTVFGTTDRGYVSPKTAVHTAAGSSSKTFVVPAGESWHIRSICVKAVTSATAGNRAFKVEILDASGNMFGRYGASVLQAASLTYFYTFAIGAATLDGGNGAIQTGLGDVVVPAGFQVKIWDTAGIDAAGDTMEVRCFIDVVSNGS